MNMLDLVGVVLAALLVVFLAVGGMEKDSKVGSTGFMHVMCWITSVWFCYEAYVLQGVGDSEGLLWMGQFGLMACIVYDAVVVCSWLYDRITTGVVMDYIKKLGGFFIMTVVVAMGALVASVWFDGVVDLLIHGMHTPY